MVRIRNFAVIVTLLLLIVTGCQTQEITPFREAIPASVNISEERLARIDNLIRQYIDSGWIAGAAGMIARDGKIVYHKAFGISDSETRQELATDNIFRIASQTKAITSVAVMTLFEQGKFLLDDKVSMYIPEFANPTVLAGFNEKEITYTTVPAKREITIRDLLTHTSGIDYAGIGSPRMIAIYAKAEIPGGFGSEGIFLADRMKALGKLPLVHQPGERFTYGLNVDVLGYLVEVWSGESLDQYFKNHIFGPLGMNDTYFYIPESKASRLVKVIADDGKSLTNMGDEADYPLLNGTYYSGGAGLSSTLKDYAIFLQMMLNGGEYNGARILAPRTVELMTSDQMGDIDYGANTFGLGFEVTSARGQAQLGISEGSFSWGGYFGTTYWADPEKKIVGLLFINQFPLRHGEIQGKFKALVYQSILD
jgi:CubicO group peptidase (beta-lactamase class C family)